MTPQIGMSDVAPRRLHISRHYGCPFCRTPRTEDGRHALAGLLACGSNASLRPSQRARTWDRQWYLRSKLAAYSCGGSHGLRQTEFALPCSLFTIGARAPVDQHERQWNRWPARVSRKLHEEWAQPAPGVAAVLLSDQLAVDLLDEASRRVETARRALDARRAAVAAARDAHEIVAPERLVLVPAPDRSRPGAEHGNATVHAREIDVMVAVVMAVEHELGTAPREHALEARRRRAGRAAAAPGPAAADDGSARRASAPPCRCAAEFRPRPRSGAHRALPPR